MFNYQFNGGLGGPESRCGNFGEDKNLLPLLGLEPSVQWVIKCEMKISKWFTKHRISPVQVGHYFMATTSLLYAIRHSL